MPEIFLFDKNRPIKRSNQLLDVTVRDFSGGLNVVDNELNLSTKFSTKLTNMQREVDGSIGVRYGTKLFADAEDYLDEIVEMEYFNGHIISVGTNGVVTKTDANGNTAPIFNQEFGDALPGAPGPWDATVFASFAIFNGQLIICNGINKPLLVNANIEVTYLQDLAASSNANTPICRYVRAHDRYLVMAGDPNFPDRLYISNTDTSGTWVGDGAPNDAVNIDLGSRVPSGSEAIKGLGRFRDKLIVAFEEALLPGDLGVFDGTDHDPTFDDAIEEHGSISHRVIQNLGEDMLFADGVGVPSVRRALFTGTITPERLSYLIDPAIQKQISLLTKTVTLEDNTFAIYDSKNFNFMLFVPNGDEDITEYRAYVYRKNKKLKIEAWSQWENWKFRAACKSSLKRIFLSEGSQIYLMGNNEDVMALDYIGDQETYDDGTTHTDQTGFTPVSDAKEGIPIPFVWELPWADNNKRFNVKQSRYVNFDTQGNSAFTAKMFVDNIYEDPNDLGEDWEEDTLKFSDGLGFDVEVLSPAISLNFVGGDAPGFGNEGFGLDGFGGGRPTARETLYAFPARYKINKMRVDGETKDCICNELGLKIVSMTLAYQDGSIRRAG